MKFRDRARLLFLIFLLQASLTLSIFSVGLLASKKSGANLPVEAGGEGGRLLKQFSFENQESLKKWEEKIFKKRTVYTLMREAGGGYLNSVSNNSSSGLYTKLNLQVSPGLNLSWKWRVIRFPKKDHPDRLSDNKQDDFAARLYLVFPGHSLFDSHVIEYIWDEKIKPGTLESSPFSDHVKLFVIRSGEPGEKNQWVEEQRNVSRDYETLFGRKPDRELGALAIMSDSDNTGTSSESDFTDIVLKTKTQLAK